MQSAGELPTLWFGLFNSSGSGGCSPSSTVEATSMIDPHIYQKQETRFREFEDYSEQSNCNHVAGLRYTPSSHKKISSIVHFRLLKDISFSYLY